MDARRLLAPLAAATLSLPIVALGAQSADAYRAPDRWRCIARHESGLRWHINTGNGYYGGLQFSRSTWVGYGGRALTGTAYAHKATKRQQVRIARRVAFRGWRGTPPQGGWSAWPNTWPRCH